MAVDARGPSTSIILHFLSRPKFYQHYFNIRISAEEFRHQNESVAHCKNAMKHDNELHYFQEGGGGSWMAILCHTRPAVEECKNKS